MNNFSDNLPKDGFVTPTKNTKEGFTCSIEYYNSINAVILKFIKPNGYGFSCRLDALPELYLEMLSKEQDYLDEIEKLQNELHMVQIALSSARKKLNNSTPNHPWKKG